MSELIAMILPVQALSPSDRREMFSVYARYYEATSWELFQSDLEEKQYALVLRDRADVIQGFTTIAITETSHNGAPLRAIFSGDTIIDRNHWGTQQLAFNWIRFAGKVKAEKPDVPLYWFLIVKGHRTYRFLPTFSIDFYPHWERPIPAQVKRLMDRLAEDRFGDTYDPETGVIEFPTSRGHLNPDLVAVSASEARRADVAFFLDRNPGYSRGNELVCLTELALDNLRPIAQRQFLEGLAE